MKPANWMLLKPLYLLPDKEQQEKGPASVADRRLASVTPVGKIISVRYVCTSRDAVGVPSLGDVVKVGGRTAEHFQSTRLVARALWRGAKRGIEIVVRNPATGELHAKTLHAKVPDGLTSYAVINIRASKIYNKSNWILNLYVHYDRHQLRWPPAVRNRAGQNYMSLPTIATIDEMEYTGMSAAHVRMVTGAEIVQVGNYTAYDFNSAAQIVRVLARLSKRGARVVLRNPLTDELDVKMMHASLLDGPAPYTTVRIQSVKPDPVANLQQKMLYVHHNKKQLRWTSSDQKRAQIKGGQLRSIAAVTFSKCVAMVRKKNPVRAGTQIVQIGERTAANFRSKRHIARILLKSAKRGVKVVFRNPATGALNAKICHAGKLATPAPYTAIKMGIKEVIKKDTIAIRLYAQYNKDQTYERLSRFDAARRMWRDGMQPIGKIATVRRVGFATHERVRIAPGGQILQIGNYTAQNFLSTRHIMVTLLKRAKRGIDVIVRDPVTGALDRKIFCTRLAGGPCPYMQVKMNMKMPVSCEPAECYVSFAKVKRRIMDK